jgi:hypothetical protein
MRIYLAGPMTGIPFFNAPAFNKAAAHLRAQGHEVFNPIENDVSRFGPEVISTPTGNPEEVRHTGLTARKVMEDDCTWICRHADAIALLPGWDKSKGARAELALAECIGLEVIHL